MTEQNIELKLVEHFFELSLEAIPPAIFTTNDQLLLVLVTTTW